MLKDVYRLIDAKGRVYLPKELRDALGLEPGGFVKLAADGCDLRVKKVHLIEMGDLSPEAIEAYVKAATAAMSQEKQIEMAALLLERGVRLTCRIVPGGEHCEASWEKQIPFFIETLMYELNR